MSYTFKKSIIFGPFSSSVCFISGATSEATEGTENTERQKMGDALTKRIIGAAIEVHRILGPGLLESIYEEALCIEFELLNIPFQRQKTVDVQYKGKSIKGQRIDLLVGDEVVVELKAISIVPEIVTSQVLSYLHATGLKRALVINFCTHHLVDGVRRISL
jgi:GxxExxY protein